MGGDERIVECVVVMGYDVLAWVRVGLDGMECAFSRKIPR